MGDEVQFVLQVTEESAQVVLLSAIERHGSSTHGGAGGGGANGRLDGVVSLRPEAMARSPGLPINPDDIYRLWDDLSDFGASAYSEALMHCVRTVCKWMHADNAFWIGAIHMMRGTQAQADAMSGWRIGAIKEPLNADGDRAREAVQCPPDDPEDACRELVARAGRFRAYRLHGGDLVDPKAFSKTRHYDTHYRQQGISDRIWVAFPVNDDAESWFCIDKHGKSRCFSQDDVQLAAQALRGIKWFHRQLMLSHGLCISSEALTDGESQVLHGLLSGATEKKIAEQVHLAPGTVHQYTVRIYRKFEVGSRAELMALWLNGCTKGSH